MKKLVAFIILSSFIISAPMAMAKGAGKAAHALNPKKRLKIQHKRIKQGVKNGTITKDEAKKLAQEGKAINQERKADLAKDGGKLTKEDRQTLEKEENQRSKEIYNEKHPAGSTSPAGTDTSGQ